MVLLQQTPSSINDYLNVFTNIYNPIFISIFLVFILIVTTYGFIKFVVRPLKNAHQYEKERLEQKNLKILALFAEVSPDPLFRLNMGGLIIDANKAAKELSENEIIGKPIHDLLPLKLNGSSFKGRLSIFNRDYSYYLKRFEQDGFLLLYLRDITEVIEYERRLKEVAKYAQNKVELERQRIALELHDDVGQNLSLAKLKVFNFLKKHSEFNNCEEITSLNEILDHSINDLRQIAYNLKPRVLDEMGFAPAVISLCSDITKDTGLVVQTEIQGKVIRLPKSVEASLYRITQEGLCNIIKHAKATECKIMLKYNHDKVKLIISDNGIGFDSENREINNKSLGLFNMRQRIEELNGCFKIETAPGQGTILFVEVNSEPLYA